MTPLPAVYLALGSNLGNRARNMAVALDRMQPLVRVEAVSSLYETDPVGPAGQPPYLNAVCRVVTGLPPQGLLRHLKEVEHEIGRRSRERWDARPIDLDILLYGDLVLDDGGLRVPHAELQARPFVLVPLAEIAPDARHPALGRTAGDLAREAGDAGVRLREGGGWERLGA